MKRLKIILLLIIGILIGGAIGIKASDLISSNQVLYKDNNTVSTALDELFSAVDINERLGNTDISGIGDGTVTGGMSELNSSLEWKLAGNATGSTEISLPIEFDELLVIVTRSDNNCRNIFYIPKIELTSDSNNFTNGYYFSDTWNQGSQIQVTYTTVKLTNFYNNNTNYLSSALVRVYYR